MKKIALFFSLVAITLTGFSQNLSTCGDNTLVKSVLKPTIGIVLYSNDAETIWNALRLANFSINKGDTVAVFLLGKGVEALYIESKEFDIKTQTESFTSKGGQILACGTCLKMRKKDNIKACTVSTLDDLYTIINQSKKILTF